jgi:Ni/Fe-hydrogenase subunit HybB-like protein
MKVNIVVHRRIRISPLTIVLLAMTALSVYLSMVRYIHGGGAISQVNNSYPWTFMLSFNLFTGIAVSSGAFILAALVYLFELEQFRPLLKPALLIGFLIYIVEIFTLLVDLGHPERIWYYIIYQNFRSWLFFVGLYVMLYAGVLIVELAPIVLENTKWHNIADLIHRFIKPIVITGAVISMLHQASLGGLPLIQSAKLHPLWWTPWLPVLFLISALAMSVAMIIVLLLVSFRYFHHDLDITLLGKLAAAIPYILGIYLVVKFAQLTFAGDLHYLFTSGWMSVLFWSEMLIGTIAPIILFSIRRLRHQPNALLINSVILLLGMTLNRFNVTMLALSHPDPITYLPTFMSDVHYYVSLPEFFVSIGIFAAAILAFGLAVKYLPIFEEQKQKSPVPGEIVIKASSKQTESVCYAINE